MQLSCVSGLNAYSVFSGPEDGLKSSQTIKAIESPRLGSALQNLSDCENFRKLGDS